VEEKSPIAKMEYRIPIAKEKRVRKILDIFDHLAPFSLLTGKDRDILAEYVNKFYELKGTISDDEIDAILFDYDFTLKISNELNTSMESVRNYMTRLRGKGLIVGRSLSPNVKALFDNIENEVTFKLDLK
jgi:hypothetical protein